MRTKKNIKSKFYSSNWQCSVKVEKDVEYYELRFISDKDVEGWVKKTDAINPEFIFSAFLMWNQNLIVIQKNEESFIAIPIGNQLIANIDDELMVFSKVA